jgi:hypothetical protein
MGFWVRGSVFTEFTELSATSADAAKKRAQRASKQQHKPVDVNSM